MATVDEFGSYYLGDLPQGTHTVIFTPPSTIELTTPDQVKFTVNDGEIKHTDFGVKRKTGIPINLMDLNARMAAELEGFSVFPKFTPKKAVPLPAVSAVGQGGSAILPFISQGLSEAIDFASLLGTLQNRLNAAVDVVGETTTGGAFARNARWMVSVDGATRDIVVPASTGNPADVTTLIEFLDSAVASSDFASQLEIEEFSPGRIEIRSKDDSGVGTLSVATLELPASGLAPANG
jgi:hypothetical protein